MKEKIKTGWALCRVSTTSQGSVQHGSIEQQENRIRRWESDTSKETGSEYKIEKIVSEQRSGKREKYHLRKDFHRLIEAITDKEIDFVVIESVTRLGRWARKNLEVIETANDVGVEIWFIDGGKYDHRNKGDRIKFGINNLMAEEESRDNSERVTKKQREAMVNNCKDSSTNPCPGLDADPIEACFYIRNEEETVWVMDIFKHFCSTGSLFETVDYCNQRGYRTKVRTTKERVDRKGKRILPKTIGGDPFDSRSLRALLISPKLRGENSFKDDYNQFPSLQDNDGCVIWSYRHGRIIPKELCDKVDSLLNENKRYQPKFKKDGSGYLLSGILVAPDGAELQGNSANSGMNHYYVIKKGKYIGKLPSLPKLDIENLIINRIETYLKDSGTVEGIIQATYKHRVSGIPEIEEEIKRTNQHIKKCEAVVENFSVVVKKLVMESPEAVKETCEALLGEKRSAEAELKGAQERLNALGQRRQKIEEAFRNATLVDFLKGTLTAFRKKSEAEKRQIIKAIIPKVVLYPEGRLELQICPDPKGKSNWDAQSQTLRHGGQKNLRSILKWREERQSTQTPPTC